MQKKYKKILFDLADTVSFNDGTAIEYLQEQGIDYSTYLNKGIREIKRREFSKIAEANLSKYQEYIDRAINIIKNRIPEGISNIEDAIRLRNPYFQFRNLKELDEHQLREILEDVDLIKAIEALDSKE